MYLLFLCVCVFVLDSSKQAYGSFDPEQVHIAFGEKNREIVVTWSTWNETDSLVQYGFYKNNLNLTSNGYSKKFVDGGFERNSQFIHRVSLQNLIPQKKYYYQCGNGRIWSEMYWFKGPDLSNQVSPLIAIYGDMGLENAKALKYLKDDVKVGIYDAIFHLGDFAYDMDSDNGRIGDKFMKQITQVSAYVPYMTCTGNHEQKYHYKAKFNMPGNSMGLYYSFNFGPVHFIFISTEVYYFLQYGFKQLVYQYNWLENDLKLATLPENRQRHPWIIIMGHRPMYCSNDNSDNCVGNHTYTRKGLPIFGLGLEDLLHSYSVDVGIWAHEHSYERFWPLYDFKMYNGSYGEPYTKPGAIVHFVTGSAGCKEGKEKFEKITPPYSAFRSNDYGFTKLKVFNSSHLFFEQISIDKNGQVIDSFWIKK